MFDAEFGELLAKLAAGDEGAAEQLWEKYYDRLVRMARRRIGDTPRRVVDEEDVVVSAFDSFCEGMKAGEFTELASPADLLGLLIRITLRKSRAKRRWFYAQKRYPAAPAALRGDSADVTVFGSGDGRGVAGCSGLGPSPEDVALLAERRGRLLGCLTSETLRETAQLKLDGHTNDEIADKMGCTRQTVKNRLRRVYQTWRSLAGDELWSDRTG